MNTTEQLQLKTITGIPVPSADQVVVKVSAAPVPPSILYFIRLDLLAVALLVVVQLVSADIYALPPPTKLVDQCVDVPPFASICIQVNKTGCLSMNLEVTMNGSPILKGEQSIAQLVNQINLNNTMALPYSYCQNVTLLGECSACIHVDSYRMTTESKSIDLTGTVSVTCMDLTQNIPITNLHIDNCFWVCPNGCNSGRCGIDGKCQCNAGYYGPDCSILENNNCYNGTIFPATNFCIQYATADCKMLDVHATSSAALVYNHHYNISEITNPVNKNKHYPLFHSNDAAISPGCRATIYAYGHRLDAQYDRNNPKLVNCRAIDYACQGRTDLLLLGTYPIDQCETIVNMTQALCSAPAPPVDPVPVSAPRTATPPVHIAPTNAPLAESDQENESSIGKNVVIALAVLVGAGILITISFVLYKRWKNRQRIEMIGDLVTEDIFDDDDDDEELVTLEQPIHHRV